MLQVLELCVSRSVGREETVWQDGVSVPLAGLEVTVPADCATPGVLCTATVRTESVPATRAGVELTARWTAVLWPALARSTVSVSALMTSGSVSAGQHGLGRAAR